MSGCLTLYSPVTCLAISSESLTTSTSVAPSAFARSSPSSRPRYSATLLVAVPIRTPASSSTSPAGEGITAAAAAGPGLPRAPPSTWTTTFTGGNLGVRRERCEVAGHARAPPVAHLTHATAAAGLPAFLLAAVDDDRHVGVVLVVGSELLVELVREGLGNDAVDHRWG